MIYACEGSDEEARLAALESFDVLDTAPEECFDRITRVAKAVMQVPIVLVSLIDHDRQWFKSKQGVPIAQTPRDISFCSHAIELTEPLIIRDATLDARFHDNPFVTGEPHIRFYIGVQLVDWNGYNLGTLCCIDNKPRDPSAEQIAILHDLTGLVMDELELRRLATTDSLTGAMTRRAFFEAARRDLLLARRHSRSLTCVMLDIDHFKAINDTYGHAAGDQVLRRMTAICKSELRGSDYICRLGGEEFAIILPETDLTSGFAVAERLREAIARESFVSQGRSFGLTVSIGVAGPGVFEAEPEVVLGKADRALYLAKASGRNRTMIWAKAGEWAQAS